MYVNCFFINWRFILILNIIPGKYSGDKIVLLIIWGKWFQAVYHSILSLRKIRVEWDTCPQKFTDSHCFSFIFLENRYYELLTASCVCVTEKHTKKHIMVIEISITYFDSHIVKWIYLLHINALRMPLHALSHSEVALLKPQRYENQEWCYIHR